MRLKIGKWLSKYAWFFFFLLLILNIINLAFELKKNVFHRQLPFHIQANKAVAIKDSSLIPLLENKTIIQIDSLPISATEYAPTSNQNNGLLLFNSSERQENLTRENAEKAIMQAIQNKRVVTVVYQDETEIKNLAVQTYVSVVWSKFASVGFNFLFLLFIFFNSYLLLKYSIHRENIFIVYFLLILSIPENLCGVSIPQIWQATFTGLAAVFFYQFIMEKLKPNDKLGSIYLLTVILAICCYIFSVVLSPNVIFLLYIWAIVWMLISFFKLWKAYKSTGSIDIKRLLNAFNGILIAILSLLMIFIIGVAFKLASSGITQFGIYTFPGSLQAILILISVLTFIFSILWFFGAFTWSLLTGTGMGVKIRSTMIYTIVGLLFVVFFGLVDYTLGELLQSLFGRFMGSEFIAGIPATIGLLMFFNPVRQKVEKIVDSHLNTSDLDFLEKTESFATAITGESVIEGFEEYICENLMQRLPIQKVALISFDHKCNSFKFNEIRGSKVKENSLVRDEGKILNGNNLIRNYSNLNENPSEIASFALIIPIINDRAHQWFLALGRKKDGTVYSKKDEEALSRLAERVKLSLKFILEYDSIIDNKIDAVIKEKNLEIKILKQRIKALEAELLNVENKSDHE